LAGDLTEGIALAEQSVLILRQVGTAYDLASAIIGLIANLSQVGAFDRVEELGDEALVLFRALGDSGKLADTLLILGLAAQFQGQHERAVAFHEENLAVRRKRGDISGAVEPMSALAGIALHQGDYLRAQELLDEAMALLQPTDAPWSYSMLLVLRGHVELAIGDLARTTTLFMEAGSLMKGMGNHLYIPFCLEGLAGVAARMDAWVLTARLHGAREALHERLGLMVPPADPTACARSRELAHKKLGNNAFAAELQAGRSLSLGDAMTMVATYTQNLATG
jgi:tetratricopeptide (TPR) repeat protein